MSNTAENRFYPKLGSLWKRVCVCLVFAALFLLPRAGLRADSGYYAITQLPYTNVAHPSINNSGEIVWGVQGSTGIVSSVRGQLSASGLYPHIANSGEVVYADNFGGGTGLSGLDLVSTTRGRLTTGGVIDLGWSDFGINATGEVVYVALDSNSLHQVYSTVRGQVTFDPVDHYNPCINDLGEILWNRFGAGPGLVSSTRGPLQGDYPMVLGVNNYDEFCYDNNLVSSNFSTGPHIFSNLHGVLVNDLYQYQFAGGINDAGVIVWAAQPNAPGPWYVFEGSWIPTPVLTIVSQAPGWALQWPTNAVGFHVQYSTNLVSPANWQALGGSATIVSTNFQQAIDQNIGSPAFFRLSRIPP